MYSFSYLEPVCCSMSSANCCFLTCIQISQEAGQVIWYSHLFKNFPQFVVIHTVKSFGHVHNLSVMIWCSFIFIVQLLRRVQLFVAPWTAARQASLSITISHSLLRLMSSESVTPSNHLILCHPLLLLPSVFPSIRVFFNESDLYIRWPKYWSFSFSISPPDEYSGLISFRIDWFDLLAVKGTLKSRLQQQYSSKHQFFGAQKKPSLWSNSHIRT